MNRCLSKSWGERLDALLGVADGVGVLDCVAASLRDDYSAQDDELSSMFTNFRGYGGGWGTNRESRGGVELIPLGQ